ncbi:MAG: hypothetical protein ACJZZ9_05705 [Cytophagales bacterium]
MKAFRIQDTMFGSVLDGWENISESNGTEKWEAREYSNNKYAQVSAYNTAETINERFG